MKKVLLLLLLVSFLASCGGGSGGAYSALFGDGPKHLQPAQQQQSTYWAMTYDSGLSGNEARSIQQTQDGGYIVAGYTKSFGAGEDDVWILKLDQNGDISG